MEENLIYIVIIGVLVGVPIMIGMMKMLLSFYQKTNSDQALIVSTMGPNPTVAFEGAIVYPIIHSAESIDLSTKTLRIIRKGPRSVRCQDLIPVDLESTILLRVNRTTRDILQVAQTIGCERASKLEALRELFEGKINEALDAAAATMDFSELFREREKYKNLVLEYIGTDLSGFKLEDLSIDQIAQTPIENLDPDNIQDAQAIQKLTAICLEKKKETTGTVQSAEISSRESMLKLKDMILELRNELAALQERVIELDGKKADK